MHELDHVTTELGAHIDRLTRGLENWMDVDTDLIRQDISSLSHLEIAYADFMTRMALGPDAPPDPRGYPSRPATVHWFVLSTKARQLQNHFREWNTLKSRIINQLEYTPQPLYPPPLDADSIEAIQDTTADHLFNLMHAFVNPVARTDHDAESGGYPDIGLPQTRFIQHMHAAQRITAAQQLGRPARFLDVGCGAGLKVMSATPFFSPAEGFDFVSSFVATAQTLLDQTARLTTKVFEADALTFDRYAEYDVIYFYCPLSDPEKLRQFEDHVAATAHPGAILIAPYESFIHRHQELGCGHLAGQIYLAHSSDEATADLRQKAEHIGPFLPVTLPDVATPWRSLQETLSKNGFHHGLRR